MYLVSYEVDELSGESKLIANECSLLDVGWICYCIEIISKYMRNT